MDTHFVYHINLIFVVTCNNSKHLCTC